MTRVCGLDSADRRGDDLRQGGQRGRHVDGSGSGTDHGMSTSRDMAATSESMVQAT
jgi:hypothetical protein